MTTRDKNIVSYGGKTTLYKVKKKNPLCFHEWNFQCFHECTAHCEEFKYI
jgi:hypothetical protein